MIKLRQAYYCNLKLFLLFLVVYGHWIERQISVSPFLLSCYRLIYLVHMPLFAFLSGLFLRHPQDCLRQIRRLLPLYALLQLIAWICGGGQTHILTPWWHLWYLLSYCLWAGIGWLWLRFGSGQKKMTSLNRLIPGLLLLGICILTGCLSGLVPWLDRTGSGSRSLVFLPYFWAGLLCSHDISWSEYRSPGMVALAVALILWILFGDQVPTAFLYHGAPYGALENGPALRLLCYALGGLLGFFLLTVIPSRRLPFTRAGADTLPGYLIHAPIVGTLREINMPWALCALFSALLLYIIYKLLQWNSPLYGITARERRGRICPIFKRYTNNTANPYTDFFCP